MTMEIGVENNSIFLTFLIENMFLETETKWNCMNGKCNITSSLRSSICHDWHIIEFSILEDQNLVLLSSNAIRNILAS